VSKLHQETVKVAAQPDMREKFAQIGVDGASNPPDEFAAIIKADTAKWVKVTRRLG
jgi:tripartite-type tricarboxylate transporter receptor subunit TctC